MAKRHPSRRKIQPTQQSQGSDDVFVARVFEMSTWARKNSQLLVLAGIAFVLVAGGVVYYWSYRQDLNRQAVRELEGVQQVVQFGLPEESEIRLNDYLQRFGGTRHEAEARLLLGRLHLQEERPAQAIEVLEAGGSGNDPMDIQLRMLLASAYEAAGRAADAERAYLDVAADARMGFQRTDALADAARLRELQGNASGAAELYRQILETVDQTDPQRGLYEMRLAETQLAAGA